MRVNGTDSIVLDENFSLGGNGYYSVIAQGLVSSAQGSDTELELEVIDDTENRNNNVNDVTVVHAAPEAGNVNVFVTADEDELPASAGALANFEFDNDETLTNITSGDYQVRITGVGSTDVVYNSATLPVSADVTAVAVQSTKGVSPVSLLIWTDAVTPVLDATAEVRIVHAVDAVDVDVFAGGAELLGDFSFKDTTIGKASATGYLTVASGELPVAIAAANNGIENAISSLSGTLTLDRGESYTVIAAGDAHDLDSAKLIVLNDKRVVSEEGTAEVRIVHASSASGADPVDLYLVAADTDITPLNPNFDDVRFGSDTGYIEVAATSNGSPIYDAVVAADGTKTAAVANLENLEFNADTITTVLAVGNNTASLERLTLHDDRSQLVLRKR